MKKVGPPHFWITHNDFRPIILFDKVVMNIFLLWHTHELPGGEEDSKLIGVYSSRGSAQAAQSRASQLPGFSSAPQGFTIDSYELEKDEWREGFVTGPMKTRPNQRTSRQRRNPGSVLFRSPQTRRA